jgi:hypothetical protein
MILIWPINHFIVLQNIVTPKCDETENRLTVLKYRWPEFDRWIIIRVKDYHLTDIFWPKDHHLIGIIFTKWSSYRKIDRTKDHLKEIVDDQKFHMNERSFDRKNFWWTDCLTERQFFRNAIWPIQDISTKTDRNFIRPEKFIMNLYSSFICITNGKNNSIFIHTEFFFGLIRQIFSFEGINLAIMENFV